MTCCHPVPSSHAVACTTAPPPPNLPPPFILPPSPFPRDDDLCGDLAHNPAGVPAGINRFPLGGSSRPPQNPSLRPPPNPQPLQLRFGLKTKALLSRGRKYSVCLGNKAGPRSTNARQQRKSKRRPERRQPQLAGVQLGRIAAPVLVGSFEAHLADSRPLGFYWTVQNAISIVF